MDTATRTRPAFSRSPFSRAALVAALALSMGISAACSTTSASTPAPRQAAETQTMSETKTSAAISEMTAASQSRIAQTPKDETAGDTLHGVRVPDPWRWLEDEKAPDVQKWMAEEDALARSELQKLPLRESLRQRMRQLFYADAAGVPSERGGRLFYMRTLSDREKAILYVRDGRDGQERVLLDPNGWSADGSVSLGDWNPSPDGKKLAYLRRPNAADEAVLYVLDVDSGAENEADVIDGAKYAWPSWAKDSSGFWYGRLPVDDAIPVDERPGHAAIYFHRLGVPAAQDRLVHAKTGDPATFIDVSASRDGSALFVSILRGWSENDIYALDLAKHADGGENDANFTLIARGTDATYEYLDSFSGYHYFLTNRGAPGKRVMRVPAGQDLAFEKWQEVVPERAGAALEGAKAVGGSLVLAYLEGAESRLYLADADGKNLRAVALPGIGSVDSIAGSPEGETGYFSFTGFAVPKEVHSLNTKTAETGLWAASSVRKAFDADAFTAEKILYRSKDGTEIPLFIVHKKGLKQDGSARALLYGYGGFMVSMTPRFRASIIPWLEAGGIYAVPCLRGGGEFGKAWHDAGRGKNKQNVFDDLEGAARFLIDNGWTSPKRLAVYGGSNGGLLVGAAITQHPELYGAAVCAVPLLDMIRYQKFGSGRTWIPEYGTAERAEDFPVLMAYTPYNNVRRSTFYPPLLMLSADHDDRVDPMHARKFVAAIRDASPESPVLLRIEKNSGHGGADQVDKAIEQNADIFAFLMEVLGGTAR